MDNNKNRIKDRPKSASELRKMEPKDNEDVGRKNGYGPKQHDGGHEKMSNASDKGFEAYKSTEVEDGYRPYCI